MAPHGKELSEDLGKKNVLLYIKYGVGYKKIAKTLKLSCRTVGKDPYSGFLTGQVPLRTGLAMVDKEAESEAESTCSASYPDVVFGK